jgi:hypothetical protein
LSCYETSVALFHFINLIFVFAFFVMQIHFYFVSIKYVILDERLVQNPHKK